MRHPLRPELQTATPNVEEGMTISADCLEQMRLMTEAAQSASKGAHRVADQMERINDFLDGAS